MPTYERGDYVKVEFPDEATGVGEWMWVRVDSCDDARRMVFGVLDSVPLDYGRKLHLVLPTRHQLRPDSRASQTGRL
jgi:hypothetical protein